MSRKFAAIKASALSRLAYGCLLVVLAWDFGLPLPASAQTVAAPNSVFKAGNVYGLSNGTTNIGSGNMAGGHFGNGSGTLFDVAVTNGTGAGNQLFILQSNGDGSFSLQPSGIYNFGTAVQDGLNLIVAGPVVSPTSKDLVVTDDRGGLYLLKGNGDGTFQTPFSLGQTANTLTSYLNSSGTLNLVISNVTFPTSTTEVSTVTVLANGGSGNFTPTVVPVPARSSPNVTSAFALNAGGFTAVLQLYSDGTTGLSQQVSGAFQPPVLLGALGIPSGSAVVSQSLSVFTFNGQPYLTGIVSTPTGALTSVASAYVWPFGMVSGGIGISATPSLYSIPTNDAVYVTTADLDGDGIPDLIVLGGGQFSTKQTVNLFLSGSPNGFAPPEIGTVGTPNEILGPGEYGTEVIVADANGDGKNDLLVYEPSQGLTVLLNQGSGVFLTPTTYAAGNTPRSIAKADFNGDGIDDLVVANSVNSATNTSDNTVSVFVSKAAGSYASQAIYPTGTDPIAVATGKVNGNQSVFVLNSADTSKNFSNPVVSFLQGNGDGTFQAPIYFSTGTSQSAQPLAIVAGAFDTSGNSTVAVGNSDGTINLFSYQAGAFLEVSTLKATSAAPAFGLTLSSLAVADMNGDGNLDLVATLRGQCGFNFINGQETLSGGAVLIFLGNGAGAFQSPVTVTTNQATFDPASVSLGSLVNVTRIDMLVVDAKASGDPCSAGGLALPNPIVFTNGGNLTFTETDLPAQFGGVPLAAIVDVNGDGANDLIFSQNGLVSALMNSGTGTFTSTPTIYVGSSSSAGLVTGSFFGPGGHDAALASSSGMAVIQGTSAAPSAPAHLVLGAQLVTGGALAANTPVTLGLTLTDGSPVTATNVKITATLPVGIAFVSGGTTSIICGSLSATQVVCTTPSLAPLANPGVIPFTITAAQAGTYTIPFSVAADEPEGIPSSDAQAVVGLQIGGSATAHLVIDGNLVTQGILAINTNVTLGLILTNGGPAAATNVKLVGNIPSGLTFVSGGTAAVPCSVSGSQILCTVSTFATSANFGVIPIIVTTTQPATYDIPFSVTSDEPEGIPSSDARITIGLQINQPQADLALSVVTLPSASFQNSNLTYLFNAANNGPFNATNATILFAIPPSALFVSVTPGASGSCSAGFAFGLWACNLGSIPVGSSASFSLVVKPSLVGPFTINFSASADQLDIDPITTLSVTVQINPTFSEAITASDEVFITALLSNFSPPAAAFSNSSLGFGNTLGSVQTLVLSSIGGAPLVFSAAPTTSPGFQLTATVCSNSLNSLPSSASLPSGSQCVLTITYTGGSPTGTIVFSDNAALSNPPSAAVGGNNYTQTIQLNAAGGDSPVLSPPLATVNVPPISESIILSDQVFITASLSNFSPPAAAFSNSSLGFAGTVGSVQTFTLSSVGGAPLILVGSPIISSGFSLSAPICSMPLSGGLPTGGQCLYTVTYSGGLASGTIVFTDNAALSSPASTPSGLNYAQSIQLNGAASSSVAIGPPSATATIPTIIEPIEVTDMPVVSNTEGGTNVTVKPLDTTTGTSPVTLTFTNVSQPGVTSLTTGPTGPPPPIGFQLGNPRVYYKLSTTAIYTGSVTICINYTGISFTQLPHVYHYQNSAWTDVTTSINTTNMIACGTTTSFSPFALFQPTAFPTTTSISAPGITYGTPASVIVSVGASGGAVTGSVSLSVDGGASTMALTGGSASFNVGVLSAGSHSLSATFVAPGNFLGSSAAGTLSVAQAPLTVTANGSSRQYGGVDPAFTVSYSGVVNGDGPGSLSGKLTCTAGDAASSPVGNYAINCSGLSSPNYAITFVPGTLTVTKAVLTITANNVTKTLNAANPTFGWTASGFVNGENASVFTATPTCTTTATTTSPVGSYSITCSGANAANYTFSYVLGTLKIVYAPNVGHVIQPPVNADGTSVFKQGRTIPAQFSVYDANGVSIGTPGVVTSFFLTRIVSGTVTTTVDNVVDTNNPDTAFRWDPTGQQWIFNITTGNLSAGSTYIYTITLNDSSTIIFQYGLR